MTEKRPYTMSEQALAQRRNAAQQSTGPITEQGKANSSRNAWKTGEHSQASQMWQELGMLGAMAKPCRTTCPKHPERNSEHPCTLVLDGLTQPGGDCLDKGVYVQAFDTIMQALHSGELASAHGLLANQAAGAIDIITRMREAIVEKGVYIEKPIVNKEGNPVINPKTGDPYTIPMLNPVMKVYHKALADLGINLPELMMTPKQVQHANREKEHEDNVTQLLGGILGRFSGGRVPETIDASTDDDNDDDS